MGRPHPIKTLTMPKFQITAAEYDRRYPRHP